MAGPEGDHEQKDKNVGGELRAIRTEQVVDCDVFPDQVDEWDHQQCHRDSGNRITEIDESVETALGCHAGHGVVTRLR